MTARHWLDVFGPDARLRKRVPLAGGYSAPAVERVTVDVGGAVRTAVLKRTGAAEVAAMRAIAVVRDPRLPRALGTGRDDAGHWLLLEHHDGPPLDAPDGRLPVPDAVWEVLSAVHRHWLRRRPRGLPVVDAAWWRRLVAERTLPAVHGAAERTGDPALRALTARLPEWAVDGRIARALAVLPRTLVHGDAHRGNVLLPPSGPVLVDWGAARVAPAALDVATLLGARDEHPPPAYRDPDPALAAVAHHWARVHAPVQYLGFAADHLGADRVLDLAATAERALAAL